MPNGTKNIMQKLVAAPHVARSITKLTCNVRSCWHRSIHAISFPLQSLTQLSVLSMRWTSPVLNFQLSNLPTRIETLRIDGSNSEYEPAALSTFYKLASLSLRKAKSIPVFALPNLRRLRLSNPSRRQGWDELLQALSKRNTNSSFAPLKALSLGAVQTFACTWWESLLTISSLKELSLTFCGSSVISDADMETFEKTTFPACEMRLKLLEISAPDHPELVNALVESLPGSRALVSHAFVAPVLQSSLKHWQVIGDAPSRDDLEVAFQRCPELISLGGLTLQFGGVEAILALERRLHLNYGPQMPRDEVLGWLAANGHAVRSWKEDRLPLRVDWHKAGGIHGRFRDLNA